MGCLQSRVGLMYAGPLKQISQNRGFLVAHVHMQAIDMDRLTIVQQLEMINVETEDIVLVRIQGAYKFFVLKHRE